MDIDDLRIFIAVADTGSFSRAAEQVFLTQPAVSKRIAGLEADLGARLFDRIGKRVLLTEAGSTLLPRARQLRTQLEDARVAIGNLSRETRGQLKGKLRLAISHHIGLHRLPASLARVTAEAPQLELDIRFVDSEQGCGAVLRGDVEFAVVTLPGDAAPQLRLQGIWNDALDLVVGKQHPLAGIKTISLDQLVEVPALLPGRDTVTHRLIMDALHLEPENIRIGMMTNYLEVLKMLSAVGLGWTAIPRTMIDDTLKVVQIKGVSIARTLGIVTHRERTLSNAARWMMSLITETATHT